MRFFIINTDYLNYINSAYNSNPLLRKKSFEEQYDYRMGSLFGVVDFYSRNLKKLGHEAIDIIANHEPIQKQWAVENGMNLNGRNYFSHIPFIKRMFRDKKKFKYFQNYLKEVICPHIYRLGRLYRILFG